MNPSSLLANLLQAQMTLLSTGIVPKQYFFLQQLNTQNNNNNNKAFIAEPGISASSKLCYPQEGLSQPIQDVVSR